MLRRRELESALALLGAPRPSALLLTGSPGSGKSRLLHRIGVALSAQAGPGAGAERTSHTVHHTRIDPAEGGLPFSGLSVVRSVLGMPGAATAARDLICAPLDGPAEAVAVAARAAEFLAELEKQPLPTILLIDDIDDMDAASHRVLAMIAARLGSTSLRIAATATTTAIATTAAAGGDAAFVLPSAARLRLEPLGFEESVRFAGRVASGAAGRVAAGPIDDAVMRIVVAVSAGSVLALERNIRSLSAAQRSGVGALELPWVPADVAAGTPTELLTAAAVCAAEGQIGPAIGCAERALASGLAGAPDQSDLVAGLLGLAEALLLRGEMSAAGRYARFGQRLAGTESFPRQSALIRLRVDFLCTDRLSALDVAQQDDSSVSEHEGDSSSAGCVMPNDDQWALDRLLVVAQFQVESWQLDAAQLTLNRARSALLGSRGLSGSHAPSGCSEQSREDIELTAAFLAASAGVAAPAAALLDRITFRGVSTASAATLAVLGRSLMLAERHDDARELFRALHVLDRTAEPLWLQQAHYWAAENAILAGNYREAVALIALLDEPRSAIAGAVQIHRGLHTVLLAWYWFAQGDQPRAAAALTACFDYLAAAPNAALAARAHAVHGSFLLLAGHPDEALAFLRRSETLSAALGQHSLRRHQADLIEACLLTGRTDEAADLLSELHTRANTTTSRWVALAEARVRAMALTAHASVDAFRHALRLWQPGDPPFELARIHLSFAWRLQSLGHEQESAEQFRAARVVFEELGATVWATRCTAAAVMAVAPVGPVTAGESARQHPLLALLTPDEAVVADLVCRGLRNREVAAELFVSLRTVEVRLTRIYHKVGARSRSHLAAMLSGASQSVESRSVL